MAIAQKIANKVNYPSIYMKDIVPKSIIPVNRFGMFNRK